MWDMYKARVIRECLFCRKFCCLLSVMKILAVLLTGEGSSVIPICISDAQQNNLQAVGRIAQSASHAPCVIFTAICVKLQTTTAADRAKRNLKHVLGSVQLNAARRQR